MKREKTRRHAMFTIYIGLVHDAEETLRDLRRTIQRTGHITHAQWRTQLQLKAQVRMLYALRTEARELARARYEQRKEAASHMAEVARS